MAVGPARAIFATAGNSKWPPAAILNFLRSPIITNSPPKSKCNTSKLVDFMPINIFSLVLVQKNILWALGAENHTKNDPKIEKNTVLSEIIMKLFT